MKKVVFLVRITKVLCSCQSKENLSETALEGIYEAVGIRILSGIRNGITLYESRDTSFFEIEFKRSKFKSKTPTFNNKCFGEFNLLEDRISLTSANCDSWRVRSRNSGYD